MKKALYIGQCEFGSTSRMRFEILQSVMNLEFELIDLTPIIMSTPKLYRSIGWRFKLGPLISKINSRIIEHIATVSKSYDVIWIDKGVFIELKTLIALRKKCIKLVHYTPDPAFLYHNSRFFLKSLRHYDHCITTKSFEIQLYKKYGCKDLIYITQGFDKNTHFPQINFSEKKYDVCFIGHFEKERADLVQMLLDNEIEVLLAGIKWGQFVKKNKNKKLIYFGNNVAGADYSRLISESYIALGLLSKWIPEKHTTRTFEIPACKTCLVTELNEEISSFFSNDECLTFSNGLNFLTQIKEILKDKSRLEKISELGYQRVHKDCRDYQSQMSNICQTIFN